MRTVLALFLLCLFSGCSAGPGGPEEARRQGWGACPWPPGLTGLTQGAARVRALVSTAGVVQEVEVLSEAPPGRLVGEHTASCVSGMNGFEPALDRDGQPVVAWTEPFVVRYRR